LIKEIIFTKERIFIDFFEVPSIEEIIKDSSEPSSFHQRIDWLRKSNSMRNFGHRFDVRTYQVERGRYKIEVAG